MNASERAYTFTKERILDGRFCGGDLISEGGVAHDVGLSRTPVREAFLRLEGEGLLRLYPKRGALIVPVSAAEMESVMETRLVVERFAIEKVIRQDIDLGGTLEAAIDRQRALADAGRGRQFVEADRAFHRLLVAAAGNELLLQLHDALRDRQRRMGLVALARDAGRSRQILEDHEALAEAVAARDEDLALEVVDRHLHATLALLRGGADRVGSLS